MTSFCGITLLTMMQTFCLYVWVFHELRNLYFDPKSFPTKARRNVLPFSEGFHRLRWSQTVVTDIFSESKLRLEVVIKTISKVT